MVEAAKGPRLAESSFKMRRVFSAAGTLEGLWSVIVMIPSSLAQIAIALCTI